MSKMDVLILSSQKKYHLSCALDRKYQLRVSPKFPAALFGSQFRGHSSLSSGARRAAGVKRFRFNQSNDPVAEVPLELPSPESW